MSLYRAQWFHLIEQCSRPLSFFDNVFFNNNHFNSNVFYSNVNISLGKLNLTKNRLSSNSKSNPQIGTPTHKKNQKQLINPYRTERKKSLIGTKERTKP